MDIISLVMFVYIALILMFISKAIKASARKRTMQNRASQPQQTRTFTQSSSKTGTGSEYINSERKKEAKKKITVFGKKEPDCDLDERYFGSRNKNKDLW